MTATYKTRKYLESLHYHVMPIDQGQIVTNAYACDEYHLYCRTYDASDRTTRYSSAEWTDGEFEPWNGKLPEHGDWEEIELE